MFEDPKVDLEQYPTGPHLASRLLFTVGSHLNLLLPCCSCSNVDMICVAKGTAFVSQVENAYNEFEGRVVVDLGCGTVSVASVLIVLIKQLRCKASVCETQ